MILSSGPALADGSNANRPALLDFNIVALSPEIGPFRVHDASRFDVALQLAHSFAGIVFTSLESYG